MYTKSQYEGSYYNNANNAHTSAADLMDGMSNGDQMFTGERNMKILKNGNRGVSASGARRNRPMTAKAPRNGLH
jgi:hypothetical protein